MRNLTMKTGIAFAAALLALSACSQSEPEQAPDANMSDEVAPEETATPEALPSGEPAELAPPVEDTNTAAIDVPPEKPVAPDAQVLDDADATGMTARVSRDEAAETNDQAPQ